MADANGEPASGSANIRETLAGADFFENEVVRQAEGLVDRVERVERRLELIEIAARHWNTPDSGSDLAHYVESTWTHSGCAGYNYASR